MEKKMNQLWGYTFFGHCNIYHRIFGLKSDLEIL